MSISEGIDVGSQVKGVNEAIKGWVGTVKAVEGEGLAKKFLIEWHSHHRDRNYRPTAVQDVETYSKCPERAIKLFSSCDSSQSCDDIDVSQLGGSARLGFRAREPPALQRQPPSALHRGESQHVLACATDFGKGWQGADGKIHDIRGLCKICKRKASFYCTNCSVAGGGKNSRKGVVFICNPAKQRCFYDHSNDPSATTQPAHAEAAHVLACATDFGKGWQGANGKINDIRGLCKICKSKTSFYCTKCSVAGGGKNSRKGVVFICNPAKHRCFYDHSNDPSSTTQPAHHAQEGRAP
jgi:hypothetical protein